MAATRNALLGAAAVVAAAAVSWMIATPRATLFTIVPDPAMVRPRGYAIMNPFRDRTPERVAERCLAEIAAGRFDCAPGVDAHIIETERRFPIRRWRLARREDTPGGSRLAYCVSRGNGYLDEEEAWIVLNGSGRRARVTEYSAVY